MNAARFRLPSIAALFSSRVVSRALSTNGAMALIAITSASSGKGTSSSFKRQLLFVRRSICWPFTSSAPSAGNETSSSATSFSCESCAGVGKNASASSAPTRRRFFVSSPLVPEGTTDVSPVSSASDASIDAEDAFSERATRARSRNTRSACAASAGGTAGEASPPSTPPPSTPTPPSSFPRPAAADTSASSFLSSGSRCA
mmetsp:Transcript_5201/g.20971  ORF Transcript_5201/g.20971 Transcript_5201/m.20971 type:complete len:201 (-) Transcript_5201:1175-1777(-)